VQVALSNSEDVRKQVSRSRRNHRRCSASSRSIRPKSTNDELFISNYATINLLAPSGPHPVSRRFSVRRGLLHPRMVRTDRLTVSMTTGDIIKAIRARMCRLR
jgi:hypothetical protein